MANEQPSDFRSAVATGAAMFTNLALAELADRPAAVIPEGYKLVALEPHMHKPHDFSGHFKTDDIMAMDDYLATFATPRTRVFVDPANMSALAIFDHGQPDDPSWRTHKATLALRVAPEFDALLALNGRDLKQRQILDFIADWHPLLAFAGEGEDVITPAVAIQRLQKLETTATLNASVEEKDTAQARSLSERRSVTSKPPTTLTLTTPLYLGMEPRDITARLIYVADKEPAIKLRIVGLDSARLETARAFSARLQASAALKELGGSVFIGSFAG